MHFNHQERLFSELPQHSTEIGESSHRQQLKDDWKHSNHHDVTWQLIDHYGRRHVFVLRLLNLRVLLCERVISGEEVQRVCYVKGFRIQGDVVLTENLSLEHMESLEFDHDKES